MAALKYPARLESNNPAAYGIVKANEISGHKTTNIAFLTSIPDAILSESGNNTNDDAIGQIWCTTDSEYGTLKYYKLTNWNKRNDYTGWKEIYALDDDFNSDIKGGLCRLVDLYDEKSNNKINVNLSALYIKNGGMGFLTKTVTIPLASSTEIGLMSSADKTKLDSIQGNGGEDNVIESIKVNGTALPITDKSVDIPIETVDLSNYIQNSASDKDNLIRIASLDVILNSNFSTILVDSYGTTISSNENTNIICDKYRLALFDYYTGIILSNPDKTEKIEIGGGEAGNGNKFTRFTSNNLDFTNVKAFTGIKTINGQSILGTGNISIDFSFVEINTSLNNIQDPKENKLYLISSLQQGTDGSGNRSGITENNIYEEYIYVNGAFEKIGEVTSSIDLSLYYTKTETDNKISLNNTHLINTIKSSTKTINGTNIWGEGDITVNTDLSNYIGNVNITKTSIDSYNNNLQSKLSFNNNNSTLLYKVSNDTDETIASLTAHNNGISINTDDSDGNLQLNMNIDTKEIVFDTTLNSFNSNIIINPEYITIASNNLDLSQVKSVSGLKTINGKSILGNDNIIVPTLTSYEGTVDLRNSGRSSYGAIQLSNNTPKLFNNYGGTYESVEVTNEGPAIYNTNTDKTSGVIAKYNADNMYNKVISSDNTLTSELYIEENYTKLTGNYNGITTGCYVFTDEARTEIDSTDNTNKNQSSISVSNENIYIGSRNIVDNENTTSGIGIQQTKISLDTPNLDFTEVQSVTGLKTVNGQSILGNGNISTSYTLPIASDTVLGGVKVGAGLSINNGVLSANGGGTADAVDWSNVQNKPTFATVATSGSYNDLTDKPSIYTLPVANNESLGGVILGRETYSSLGEFTIIADSNNRIYTTIPYAKDGILPNNLGLITKKDYTNFLENYDWYKSITGDDTDTIINKYQEIVNFLDTYTEADTLANILSNKADKTDVNSIAADVAALDADKADKTELATKVDVEIVEALSANVNTLNTSKADKNSIDLLDQKIDEVNNSNLSRTRLSTYEIDGTSFDSRSIGLFATASMIKHLYHNDTLILGAPDFDELAYSDLFGTDNTEIDTGKILKTNLPAIQIPSVEKRTETNGITHYDDTRMVMYNPLGNIIIKATKDTDISKTNALAKTCNINIEAEGGIDITSGVNNKNTTSNNIKISTGINTIKMDQSGNVGIYRNDASIYNGVYVDGNAFKFSDDYKSNSTELLVKEDGDVYVNLSNNRNDSSNFMSHFVVASYPQNTTQIIPDGTTSKYNIKSGDGVTRYIDVEENSIKFGPFGSKYTNSPVNAKIEIKDYPSDDTKTGTGFIRLRHSGTSSMKLDDNGMNVFTSLFAKADNVSDIANTVYPFSAQSMCNHSILKNICDILSNLHAAHFTKERTLNLIELRLSPVYGSQENYTKWLNASVIIEAATTAHAGIMSALDKTKLNNCITSSDASTIANGAVTTNENAKATAKETILSTVNNMVPTLFDTAGNNVLLKIKAIDVVSDINTLSGNGLWKIVFCAYISDQSGSRIYLIDKRDNNNIIHPEYYSNIHPSEIISDAQSTEVNGVNFFTLIINETCNYQIFDYQLSL